ncbi:MAG: hypothetical protein IPN34_17455 [Planctomycetes bacterium]|nr:hypothetical protein [Planctomycetota bacterium]
MTIDRALTATFVALLCFSCTGEDPAAQESISQKASRIDLLQRAASLLDGAADVNALRAAEPELDRLAKQAKDLPPLEQTESAKAVGERIEAALKKIGASESEMQAAALSLLRICGVNDDAEKSAPFLYTHF